MSNGSELDWLINGHPRDRLLEAIDGYWKERGYTPNLTEVAALSGLSKAHTHKLLSDMRDEGLIEWVTQGRQTKLLRSIGGS